MNHKTGLVLLGLLVLLIGFGSTAKERTKTTKQATKGALSDNDDSFLKFGLTGEEKKGLIEYLKSL